MDSSNNSNFVDVDFDEINDMDKQISGEPLYFTTTQVATMLGITDSKVRYYSRIFSNILQIKISNKHRKYTKTDIEKMKFINELKKEGLTLRQIQEYCSEKNIDKVEKDLVIEDNPLQIQVFMKALTEELSHQLNSNLSDFKTDIINKIQENLCEQATLQEKSNDKLKEQLAITLDECCIKKIDSSFENLKSYLDEKEFKARDKDIEMIDKLKQAMEDTRKKNETEQGKKGFLSKLFSKK